MSVLPHTPGPWVTDVEAPMTLGGDYITVDAVVEDGTAVPQTVRREIANVPMDTGDGSDSPAWAEDKANAQLLALAITAPHDCPHEGCPGRENKRKLEAVEALRAAVIYALNRAQTDPEFRWHMLGTETLDRLVRAEAAFTGRTEEEVRRETDRPPEWYRRRRPECALNRERVRKLEIFIEAHGYIAEEALNGA